MEIQLSDHFDYKRLLRFCLSPIGIMVFTSVYGMVDGFFVSNCVGKVPFASINLIMPFLMLMGGFGFMIGTGGSALIAKKLGEGEPETANKYFTMLCKFNIYLGLILTVIGVVFVRPVSIFFGATPDMIEDCVIYGRLICAFTITFVAQVMFQTFLTTAEKPKLALKITLWSGITNMVLDALFVWLFDWGVVGAALATGISQAVGGVPPLIYFLRKNDSRLRFVKARIEARVIIRACTNGISELLGNISGSIIGILYNYQLLKYAGETGVASYGVLMYVQFIYISIFIGYTMGMSPIVSFNYGARNDIELKNVFKKSVVIMTIFGIGMIALAEIIAWPMAKIFVGYDAALMEMTVHGFRICGMVYIFSGFGIFGSAFFTALNNGLISGIISLLRSFGFQLAGILILPVFFGMEGVWWSMIVADVMAFLITFVLIFAFKKRYHYM